MDTTLRYVRKRWSFDLLCTNLFDTRYYSLRSYNSINQYNQLYILRFRQMMAFGILYLSRAMPIPVFSHR